MGDGEDKERIITYDMAQKEDPKQKTDKEKFNEEFDRIGKLRDESETLREQRTFDIASGGLTVSIGIFTYLATHLEKVPSVWMIIAIMACFGLALLLNYFSHMLSVKCMEEIQKWINAHDKKKYDAAEIQKKEDEICKYGPILNWIVTALIIVGIVMIVIYGIKYVLL